MWPIDTIRQDFPILSEQVHGYPLAYLDNAATTQKPQSVIEAITHYYEHDNANVHRGVHTLSARATEAYEKAREKIAHFIGAKEKKACIFVRGTTEALNLVAESYARPRLRSGDEVLITYLEHHANILPWQRVCEQTGAKLVVAKINEKGEVLQDDFLKCLSSKTKLVAFAYASNALGTVNPVKKMADAARAVGAIVVVDGAQAAPHFKIDVEALGCDFFAFSGHKCFGPTGIGVLWGKADLLDSMSVYQVGGEMIERVRFEHTDFAKIPAKFEAGTPNIAGAIGLGAAVDYLGQLDTHALHAYEKELLAYAEAGFKTLKGYRVIGEATHKVPLISFIHPKIHAHDIGTLLDSHGIAIRTGHHCAMPLMDFFNVVALGRLSLAFYNTKAEIERCIEWLAKAEALFL